MLTLRKKLQLVNKIRGEHSVKNRTDWTEQTETEFFLDKPNRLNFANKTEQNEPI